MYFCFAPNMFLVLTYRGSRLLTLIGFFFLFSCCLDHLMFVLRYIQNCNINVRFSSSSMWNFKSIFIVHKKNWSFLSFFSIHLRQSQKWRAAQEHSTSKVSIFYVCARACMFSHAPRKKFYKSIWFFSKKSTTFTVIQMHFSYSLSWHTLDFNLICVRPSSTLHI